MLATDVPSISIRPESCERDGLCARLCPARVFEMRGGGTPSVHHTEECVLCGQCVAGCPSGAIVHSGLDPARLRRIPTGSQVSPQAAYQLLSERRSVRNYKKEAPTRELLERILEAAGYAPGSPHHRVGWVRSFTVVAGEANTKRVRSLTVEYVRRIYKLVTGVTVRLASTFDASAKAARAIAPDLAMRLKEWDEGRDVITYDAPAMIFAHAPEASSLPQIDCDAAMLSVLLLAHAHGLGACWNGLLQDAARGNHLRGFSALRDFLGIPKGHKCYAAATVGYAAVRLHSVPPRDVAVTWIGY